MASSSRNQRASSRWLFFDRWNSSVFSPGPSIGRRHHNRRFYYSRTYFTFLFLILILLTIYMPLLWLFPAVPPKPPLKISMPCDDDGEGYIVEETGICTHRCGSLCFPRVHGICFSHTQVTICDGQPLVPQHIAQASGGLPSEMRFNMENPRQKIPVRHGACPGWNPSLLKPEEDQISSHQAHWIPGLQMVADLTLMPVGRAGPNPHHEAEKVVPAVLFSRLAEFKNSSLHWFADPKDPQMISKWSLGLLDVFADDLKVKYLSSVTKGDAPICFEDAVLFTGLTNSGYMPNVLTHNWFRKRVLKYCKIPAVNAHWPVKNGVIVHRPNSSRNILNYELVRSKMEEKLQIPIKIVVPGPWPFCDQVRLVAETDIVLTPHGSQNANLLVLRPGAVVIEVFPLLYYIDWYRHYLQASGVSHYELFGSWPLQKSSMPLLMRIYASLYGWEQCFNVKQCMNYAKSQQIYVDVGHLDRLFKTLNSECNVRHSHCRQK